MSYVAKRLVQIPIVVFLVVTLGFVLLKMAPGDPASLFAGEGASPQYVEMIRRAYGLDKPVFEQYKNYIYGIFTGDWGFSPTFERPVLRVIMERIPLTLLLSFTAFCISIPLGVVLGMIAALKRNSPLDSFLSSFATFFDSVPAFIIGLLLLYAISVYLGALPLGGFMTVGAVYGTLTERILDIIAHLVLPATSLALIWIAGYTRVTRNVMIEALQSDYVRAAVSRGIKRMSIIFKHALRNSILSVVTLAGVQVGYMLGGVILTETVFSWFGIGHLIMQAVSFRDYPLMMGILFFSSVWVAIVNLVVDAIYCLVDPRVRLT